MSSLSTLDRKLLEDLLQMGGGYVLDFSNTSFAAFVKRVTNIDITDENIYPTSSLSKAKRLRRFWDIEPPYYVGKLCLELLSYAEREIRSRSDWSKAREKELEDLRKRLEALMHEDGAIPLPGSRDVDENELKNQIEQAISQGKPSVALDRLHTLATKVLKSVCATNGIPLWNEKKERYNVAQLVGMLWKKYQSESVFQSQFTVSAIKYANSVFTEFNNVRNNESYAHDNTILNNHEAYFAIKIMAEVLMFIFETEQRRIDASSLPNG